MSGNFCIKSPIQITDCERNSNGNTVCKDKISLAPVHEAEIEGILSIVPRKQLFFSEVTFSTKIEFINTI